MERSDEDLIQSHREGDMTAFAELVRRYADSLLGYLVRMCNNHQQAEDLFQETFSRVHQKADTFAGRGRFKSWLFSIASHVAIDHLRKHKRQPEAVSLSHTSDCNDSGCPVSTIVTVDTKTNTPAQTMVLAERKMQVQHALEKLTPKQRATLVLAYYQGLSYKEVAQALDCSLGTVKSQMFRALKALAGLLPDMEGDVQ